MLDLSDTKLGDRHAKRLIDVIICSNLENLNLSRNLLGFKTGAVLMNLLADSQIKE